MNRSPSLFFSKALALALAFAIFGCNPNHESTPGESASWGPTMPIQLGVDPSQWQVNDWLSPGEQVTTVMYCPGPSQCDTLLMEDGIFTMTAPPPSGLGMLLLAVGEEVRVVPVLSKGEVKHSFVWHADNTPSSSSTVAIVGDLTGWTPKPASPSATVKGQHDYEAVLRPGNHAYQWVIDGTWMTDPAHQETMSNGMGGWNSAVRIASPEPPKLNAVARDNMVLISTDRTADLVVMVDNMLVHHATHDTAITLPVRLEGFPAGRHHLRAWAASDGGISQDILIPMEGNRPIINTEELHRSDWHAATMYFLMVDRFKNGNLANDEPVLDSLIMPAANHLGGDLEGVLQTLQESYFDALGMNTVWISPVTQNAARAWGLWQDSARTNIQSRFSSYHGYWPVSCTEVDRRYGGQPAMNALTDGAHARGMNVVLDYVGNHVHENHPLMKAHPDWTTKLHLPDGSLNTERWDEHRLTTWFDTFMPTLDLERPEVAEAMSDSAAWWAFESGIDGFRHDATKHISEVLAQTHRQTQSGSTTHRQTLVPNRRDLRQP